MVRNSRSSGVHRDRPGAPARRRPTFCPCPSRQSHNTNIPKFERMWYRYHPHFGKDLEVIRKRDSCGQEERITRLPDGTRCILPAWMFDEPYCKSLPDVERGFASLPSLIRLVELLASHRLTGCSAAHDRATAPNTSRHSTRVDQPTTENAFHHVERGDGPDEKPAAVRRVARRPAGNAGRRNKQRRSR